MNRHCAALILLITSITSLASSEPRRIICTMPKGTLVHFVKPTYPLDALEKNLGGVVELTISIDEHGFPARVRVKKGNPIFAEAAVEAVQQWRWKPMKLNGSPIPLDTVVSVNFKPRRSGKR